MKYKMLVSDFDGTLFRSDYSVSERTVEAIKKFEEAGGKFFIATGRLFCAINKYAEMLGAKSEVVTHQGGAIYDVNTMQKVYSKNIDEAVAFKIYQYLYNKYPECSIPIMFYNDDCYAKENNPHIKIFTDIVKVNAKFVGSNLDEYVKINNINPDKILCLVSPERGREITIDLREKFKDYVNVNQSHSTLLEIVNVNASKGNAVKWLSEKYGIQREEIICIGDAENDNSMLIYAGLGVAVGNAMDVTKDIADFVADTNDNDGVAKVIQSFCLGGTYEYR